MNIKMIKCKVGAWNESDTHNHKSNSTGYVIISKVLCIFCDECIAQHCCFYPAFFLFSFLLVIIISHIYVEHIKRCCLYYKIYCLPCLTLPVKTTKSATLSKLDY